MTYQKLKNEEMKENLSLILNYELKDYKKNIPKQIVKVVKDDSLSQEEKQEKIKELNIEFLEFKKKIEGFMSNR